MRMLMDISLPHETFNVAVKDGTVEKKITHILQETKPEAIYFTEKDGHRGVTLIVNLDESSKIPSLAEPWFLTFNADVKLRIVMTPDDLMKAGLKDIGMKWS